MSSSLAARVKRRPRKEKQYTVGTYRKAFSLLMEDFGNRCAYSLIHMNMIGEREMD